MDTDGAEQNRRTTDELPGEKAQEKTTRVKSEVRRVSKVKDASELGWN